LPTATLSRVIPMMYGTAASRRVGDTEERLVRFV